MWIANNPERWTNSTGADRYRRAVYTFIKRTAIYPSFVTFDAADRQLSAPRRIPTNTPLQALVTLNDPVFQQAAEALAARMSRAPAGAGDAVDARLNYGARCVLSRDLTPAELDGVAQAVPRGRADGGGQRLVQSRCGADKVTMTDHPLLQLS